MHFDESQIEVSHNQVLESWPQSKILFQTTFLVSEILHFTAWRYQKPDGIASWVATMLASRQRNSIGAAFRLTACGYFSPAYSILRDVAEAGLLFSAFKARPALVDKWTGLVGQKRHESFSPTRLKKDLQSNGTDLSRFLDRIEAYSEWGVHPSSGSFPTYSDSEKAIRTYPYADRDKFASLLISIAQDSVLMIRPFIEWTDTLAWSGARPDEKINELTLMEQKLLELFPLP